jgi:hypothetical protein
LVQVACQRIVCAEIQDLVNDHAHVTLFVRKVMSKNQT